ncbi:MAG: UDP-glucose--hexose-1-phosphate uridylyltransferase [Clostridia bacterium]|nr:UDP-glucose--hexose-1-phosphate uridylyltransferase [Clostridia bacterium]
MKIDILVRELIAYAKRQELVCEYDEAYATSRLMEILSLDSLDEGVPEVERELSDILSDICAYAVAKGIIENDSVVYRDLFDTKIMGALTPAPSIVIEKFYDKYKTSPIEATDYYYRLSCDSNYIRCDRIARDLKWKYDSEYGQIDITVNLSKPEKDPKAIAAAKLLPQTDYPRCALCHENEGFAGTLSKAARQTLRQIPFDMGGEKWYLQYSPYVYYNEHCIALSAEHRPMKIDESTFKKLLGFVTEFPHYFIGSNADLKIVGGSILSHDHMQGGRYSFAMEMANIDTELSFDGYPEVTGGIVKWPMSVIRLRSNCKESLIELSTKILDTWRTYSDKDAFIYAESDGEPHNTITPIARRRSADYEIDLVLRNNITTDEHPLGLYHPHADKHNIKKENIGLIEVMGLAVLPARLKSEIYLMKKKILRGEPFATDELTAKHAEWFESFRANYEFTEENTEDILKREIGKTFVSVLRDAGVYKDTEEGKSAFLKFLKALNITEK